MRFWHDKFLQNPSPAPSLLSQNLAKTLQVLIYDNFFCFRAEIGRLPTQQVGKTKNHESGFVKISLVKNAYVGEEGDLEHALDGAFGI